MDGSTSLRRRMANRAPRLRRAYWSVRHAGQSTLSAVADPHFARETTYEGGRGKAWCVSIEWRAPSIAAFFCGEDVAAGSRGRIWRRHVPGRIERIAAAGGLGIVRIPELD